MNLKCKHCGTELAGYETFCPGCGRELPARGGAGFRPDADTTDDMTAFAADELFPETFEEPVIQRRTAPVRPVQKPVQPRPVVRKPARPETRPVQQERPVQQARPARQERRPARNSRPLNAAQRRLVLGVLAAVGVILLVLLGSMFMGGDERTVYPFTGVVDNYFSAVKTGNANTFIETRPPAYTAYLTSGSGSAYSSESEYRAKTAAALQERLTGYETEYGKIKSIKYELTDVRRYNHRCEALSDVLTGWYQFPQQAVTDAYIVSGTYTVQGAKGAGEYAIDELLLIYTNDGWYFSPDAGNYWRAE